MKHGTYLMRQKMSENTLKATIAYIADGPGGIKVEDEDDDRWYNPADEGVRSHVKDNLRVGDQVVIKYKDIPQSDDKRQVLDIKKADTLREQGQDVDGEDAQPEALQRADQDESSEEMSRYQTRGGVPRVEMPTRHGALNTAIEHLRLQVQAGRQLPSDADDIQRIVEETADQLIEYIYEGSKQAWKDHKARKNHS